LDAPKARPKGEPHGWGESIPLGSKPSSGF